VAGLPVMVVGPPFPPFFRLAVDCAGFAGFAGFAATLRTVGDTAAALRAVGAAFFVPDFVRTVVRLLDRAMTEG